MEKIYLIIIIPCLIVAIVLGTVISLKYKKVNRGENPLNDSENISPIDIKNLTITVIYDNNPYKEGLETAWGFSCLVSGIDKTILFDTGGVGSIFLANMRRLGIDPKKIDSVVLSHIHGDHVGGLARFLEKNSDVTIYLPKSFPTSFKNDIRECGAKVVEVSSPLRICEQALSTGEMGTWIKEQSLVISTNKGLVVITGCAHPGVVKIVRRAKDLLEKNMFLVMGGFHLFNEGTDKIREIITSFKKMGVQYVGPCHCSGDKARDLFEREYHKGFMSMGVGKTIIGRDFELNG
ncbi:MAG: beta-lactamase [Deltaproteobacteria bacterium DG_8]|nr:MAG: beta-lactamase [Deltaproteobacteria bacterium DG_8]